MFNPEKLLGQLVGDALSGQLGGGKRKRGSTAGGLGGLFGGSRSGMSTGTKAKLGIGLLGMAVAAYQHYQTSSGSQANPLAGVGGASPPPPPPAGSGQSPPMAGAASTPPPPPPGTIPPARVDHALHLLRAMITAAHSDGLIDATEREAIVGRARDAGMDAESLQALDAEIRSPLSLEQLAVRTPANQRDEVYAAALITITADTEAERAFLDRLAAALELGEGARRDIQTQLGIVVPG